MTALGGLNVDEVRLASTGSINLAAIGAAAPTDATTALTSAWNNVGYATKDGVSIAPNYSFGKVEAWQSPNPLLRPLESVDFELTFVIMQTNKAVSALFFGGATWVNGPAGVASLALPSNPTYSALESALTIDWEDSKGYKNRLYIPRGIVTKRDPVKLTRTDATMFGVTYSVNDSNGTLGTWYSNSPSLYSS